MRRTEDLYTLVLLVGSTGWVGYRSIVLFLYLVSPGDEQMDRRELGSKLPER